MYRYYLAVRTADAPTWQEVTKEEFVSAERSVGFHNTLGQPAEPATAGFSAGGLHGKVEHVAEQVGEVD